MKIKLSDYVVQFLVDKGLHHVFMVPGGGAMHLNDSLGKNRNIEYISNHHEQASAMAAETYARITGNFAAAMVTTGPGGTNALTGVAGAWLDSTPCLFLSGQVKRADLIGDLGVRQHGVQEVDIISIVKSITKYSVTVIDPLKIRMILEEAFFKMKSGRPGPVWIDIPIDVQASMIEMDELKGFEPDLPSELSTIEKISPLIHETIQLLNKAERPIILIGNGVRLSGAQNQIRELINILRIPFLLTWPALDLFPDDHPLLVGRPGPVAPRGANYALQNSDLLISIGARLDVVVTGYAHDQFARCAKKVMVDIDKFEIMKMKTHIDVPIICNAIDFINGLISKQNEVVKMNRAEWINKCSDWKIRYPIVMDDFKKQNPVSMYFFTEVLSDVLKEDEIVIPGSSGSGVEIFLLAFKAKKGQRVLNTTALGAMGNGLPASIGACIASNKRRTICVNGDGGLQFNIQEFQTLARLNLPIKLFVINNKGYSSIRTSQSRYFERLTGADESSGLSLPDILKVAKSYGLKTYKIKSNKNIRKKIAKILNMNGPVICEVVCLPDEPRMPSMMSVQKSDGSMVSAPLENLWPFLPREEYLSNMIIPLIDDNFENEVDKKGK
jgi:acetolactate synthase-1/2/3 large subunit